MNLKKSCWYIGVLLSISIQIQCTRGYSEEEIVGTYVNMNYEYTPFVPDIPYEKDTMLIFEDLTFRNKYWGTGKYEIKNSVFSQQIRFIYKYKYGQASFTASISEDERGNAKISLYDKKDHHYRKVVKVLGN